MYVSYGQRPFFGRNLNKPKEHMKQIQIEYDIINGSGEWETVTTYEWVDDETETNEQTK